MLLASLSAKFTALDWAVVIGYLTLTTWLGARMAGKQATIRDFFLGGRKLPWYAVSGSIIATEISAVTFVIVPFIVFNPGGNFTYLQLGVFGSFFARIVVGYLLVPAYYEREIYSPYDFMGDRLGGHVRGMTTALFALGGMLAQSARVYLTAEILNVVMRAQLLRLSEALGLTPLAWAIIFITIVAITWTLIGGITTVVWTDTMLFLVFLVGALVALGTVVVELNGDWMEMLRVGWAARESGPWGKFTFFDVEWRWPEAVTRPYTIWAAVIASTWGGVGAYGTDQLIAQRMFCCKGPREARWAIISSALSQVVTITVALVGVALFAFYREAPSAAELAANPTARTHPEFPRLRGEALELFEGKGDRIFPVFIVEHIPPGLSGLIIAGVFAAAVSSLTSILAALSQTMMSAFYLPWRRRRFAPAFEPKLETAPQAPGAPAEPTEQRRPHNLPVADAGGDGGPEAVEEDRRSVFVGRMLVLVWGVALAGMAFLAKVASEFYPSILDLALSMAGYAGGALLAGFALSFLPLRIDGRGFMYSGPLSVLCVFAMIWKQDWTHYVCWAGAALLLVSWVPHFLRADLQARDAFATLALLAGLVLLLWLSYFGYWEGPPDADGTPAHLTVSWPWQVPFGSLIAFVWGYLLARPRAGHPQQVAEKRSP
jgi:Na+/proline symporter